ncbi:MAG: hypothetical protein C0618_04375 [Desulfuromonas sp.]|nr:MAG: hypothetical protein C0618_04375 [Desulfuromonas sp.]
MPDPEWVKIADDRLIAFPGSAFLSLSATELEKMGLSEIRDNEALLLGLCGRLAKDGKSLAVSLPCPDRSLFVKLLMYLHRIRMDALSGCILGSYFQSTNLWDNNDLVWFGRTTQVKGALDDIAGLNPCRITRKTPQKRKGHSENERIARTPLVSCTQNHFDTLDLLLEKTRPFLFVIDATQSGLRENLKDLWDNLSIYFPNVPVLLFSALGDRQADTDLQRTPVHQWTHRIADQYLWATRNQSSPPAEEKSVYRVIEIPDKTISSLLTDCSLDIQNLRNQVSADSAQKKQLTYGKAAKVQQAFASLAMPLSFREASLHRQIRGGPFGVRPISRELEILEETELKYGEVDATRKKVHTDLQNLYDLIEKGFTGKAQAVEKMVRLAAKDNKSTIFLVSNKAEEDALVDFINSLNVAPVDNKLLTVQPKNSVRPLLSSQKTYSCCVIMGRLWDKEQWWLAGVAKEVYWLCYPFEVAWIENHLNDWIRKYSAASPREGGVKTSLLKMAWPKEGHLKDLQATDPEAWAKRQVFDDCKGCYVIPKEITIEQKSFDSMKWLDELLSTEEDPETLDSGWSDGLCEENCAYIFLESSTEGIPWNLSWTVHTIVDTEVEPKKVTDLVPGDQILLFKSNDAHEEILFRLFEAFDSSPQTEELMRWARYWQSLIDAAKEKYRSPKDLLAALAKQGTSVSPQTARNWWNKKVIGPDNDEAIKHLALAVNNELYAKHYRRIHRAVRKIGDEHRIIGKTLKKALVNRAAGATRITIGSTRVSTEQLDEILQLEIVNSVKVPAEVIKGAQPKKFADLVPVIEEKYQDRIILTTRAKKSMDDSPYRNLDKALLCFQSIAGPLWEHYAGGINRFDLKNEFKRVGMEAKFAMSQVTQGKSSDYDVRYKGEKIDIGPHICIGTTHDPATTLRVHFTWDADESKIVIHHAGKHLFTRKS